MNLKRPTIRLSPLAPPADESERDAAGHQQQHGLEFEFDCDAPQCAITLHVIGVPAHFGEEEHESVAKDGTEKEKSAPEKDQLLLYEAMVPGGFSRKLTLAEGAALELARLEAAEKAHREALRAAEASKLASASSQALAPVASSSGPPNEGQGRNRDRKKRLTFFRKKSHVRTQNSQQPQPPMPPPTTAIASGPALAVVDAESAQNPTLQTFFANGEAERRRREKEKEEKEGGVKVAICLSARNADGKAVGGVRNEQVTFLWVVRHGPQPASAANADEEEDEASESGANASPSGSAGVSSGEKSAPGNPNADQEGEKKVEEDVRPWVVRVVKREARIGPHAFQLHEIYGLTAHAAASEPAHPTAPTAPVPSNSPSHTYPPANEAVTTNEHPADDDEANAECLLCLSSPREVVLLPCRHLVACRECAVNMVEFGAGGTVVQPSGTGDGTAGDSATENATGGGEASVPSMGSPPAAMTGARRKRKAKGWFCPVCRQRKSQHFYFSARPISLFFPSLPLHLLAYTSLLRITTAPLPAKSSLTSSLPTDGTATEPKRVSVSSSSGSSSASGLEHPHVGGGVDGTAAPTSSPAMSQTEAGQTASTPVTLGGERADERV